MFAISVAIKSIIVRLSLLSQKCYSQTRSTSYNFIEAIIKMGRGVYSTKGRSDRREELDDDLLKPTKIEGVHLQQLFSFHQPPLLKTNLLFTY